MFLDSQPFAAADRGKSLFLLAFQLSHWNHWIISLTFKTCVLFVLEGLTSWRHWENSCSFLREGGRSVSFKKSPRVCIRMQQNHQAPRVYWTPVSNLRLTFPACCCVDSLCFGFALLYCLTILIVYSRTWENATTKNPMFSSSYKKDFSAKSLFLLETFLLHY